MERNQRVRGTVWTVIVALVWTYAGCWTEHLRAYAGPELELNQLVTLTGQWSVLEGRIIIDRIDGVFVSSESPAIREFQILPGLHTVDVSYLAPGVRSVRPVRIQFVAQVARAYEIQGTALSAGFWTDVGRAIVGEEGTWVTWVIDKQTGQVVAGWKPKQKWFSSTLEPEAPEPANAP